MSIYLVVALFYLTKSFYIYSILLSTISNLAILWDNSYFSANNRSICFWNFDSLTWSSSFVMLFTDIVPCILIIYLNLLITYSFYSFISTILLSILATSCYISTLSLINSLVLLLLSLKYWLTTSTSSLYTIIS